jgi:hypothetical protein
MNKRHANRRVAESVLLPKGSCMSAYTGCHTYKLPTQLYASHTRFEILHHYVMHTCCMPSQIWGLPAQVIKGLQALLKALKDNWTPRVCSLEAGEFEPTEWSLISSRRSVFGLPIQDCFFSFCIADKPLLLHWHMPLGLIWTVNYGIGNH